MSPRYNPGLDATTVISLKYSAGPNHVGVGGDDGLLSTLAEALVVEEWSG